METASLAYKQEMKKKFRDRSYMRVTIGLINQEAQASAEIANQDQCTYYSSFRQPLDNYQVEELYATCDQNYSQVDGSMYFLPRSRSDAVLNQGVVSENLLGSVEIRFPVAYDIKGLTVDFGNAYPVNFRIESDYHTQEVEGNASGDFVTEEIFNDATFLRFVPESMVNGASRLHIHQITMGIGVYFDNRKILSATKKEFISPIMEELPSVDFELTVNNKNREYDIEREDSSINFLEAGQEISVLCGQELDDGSVEWMPGTTVYLKEWSADDSKMKFTSTDRFYSMDGTYYRGTYSEAGISLYDLAEDVFEDAGIDSRTYWLDPYLKSVVIHNPVPVMTHKEALQIIANAGRCILYQDRSGNIFMKSSFIPDMEASSDNETYYSHAGAVLGGTDKTDYASAAKNYADVVPTQYFLPRQQDSVAYLNTGYVSEQVADETGKFTENPTVCISLEASYKCFGITLEFGRNYPVKIEIRTYLSDVLQESYQASDLTEMTVINREFPEFDRMVLVFTEGQPNNRVVLNNVSFGESTDYELEYGAELTKTPEGTRLTKVKELQFTRTLYHSSSDANELGKDTVLAAGETVQHTFYFTNASYDLTCAITDVQEGQEARIVDSSNYFATVEVTGVSGECEVVVTGKEYAVTQAVVSLPLNTTGSVEKWENPLVSDGSHADDLTEWIGNYMKSDREYDLSYRGEPRIDANDIVFLENKYVPDLLLRVCEHTLNFNGGALLGTIKARRDMDYVATAKD